jgi:uncharacterized membrane protein YvbJ
MSEFVECQNCGRRFFAENLDCPYCGGQSDDLSEVDALMQEVTGITPSRKMTFIKGPLLAIVAVVLLLGFVLSFFRW